MASPVKITESVALGSSPPSPLNLMHLAKQCPQVGIIAAQCVSLGFLCFPRCQTANLGNLS